MKKSHRAVTGLMNHESTAATPKEVWLDKQDILSRMHISERTLQSWRKEKLLPHYKIKGKIYYKESELNMMIEKGRV